MNGFRKVGLFVVAVVIVVALGAFSSSAEAGGHYSSGHKSFYSPGHFHYGGYSNYGSCYGGNYYTSYYLPTSYTYIKPVSYPVTVYDRYGRPYVVWQTSYSYQP